MTILSTKRELNKTGTVANNTNNATLRFFVISRYSASKLNNNRILSYTRDQANDLFVFKQHVCVLILLLAPPLPFFGYHNSVTIFYVVDYFIFKKNPNDLSRACFNNSINIVRRHRAEESINFGVPPKLIRSIEFNFGAECGKCMFRSDNRL